MVVIAIISFISIIIITITTNIIVKIIINTQKIPSTAYFSSLQDRVCPLPPYQPNCEGLHTQCVLPTSPCHGGRPQRGGVRAGAALCLCGHHHHHHRRHRRQSEDCSGLETAEQQWVGLSETAGETRGGSSM